LGLAVVHGVAKGLKGHIHVDSKIGKGSTFELLFPEADTEVVEQVATGHAVGTGGSETILLADDEQNVRDLIRKVLTLRGYKVLLARDGLEAIDIYQSTKDAIDLVILDMMMPNLSGRDAYKRLKEINPAVKVIFCSGYGLDHKAMEELQNKGAGFIHKPFALEQLIQAVREILDAAAPRT